MARDALSRKFRGDSHNIAKSYNFLEAVETAKSSRFLGHENWRLPTQAEMQNIFGVNCDRNQDNEPAASTVIALNLRRNSGSSPYYGGFWTSTMSSSSKAMLASFGSGRISEYMVEATELVRLVRSNSEKTKKISDIDTDSLKKTMRQKSIEIGDTVVYDKKDFKWIGIVISKNSDEYQIRLTEIDTGYYLHINSGPCTSEQINRSDVGKIIRSGKTCVVKW